MGNTTTSDYAVECDLGVANFDVPRAGIGIARSAYGEVRRLGRADPRVRSTRWRRTDRRTVRVTVTVSAADPRQAFEVAAGVLRTGIHVVGGSTAGWELLRPQLHLAPRRPRSRWGRRAEPAPLPPPPTWAGWSAAARERLSRVPALPPLTAVATSGAPSVIDLR